MRHDTRAATALLLRASAPAIILQLAEPTLTSRRFSSLPLRRRGNISPRKQAFEIDEWLRQLRLSVQNAKQRVEEQVRNYLVPIRLHPPSSHSPSSVSYSYSRLFSHSHSQRFAPSASIMRLYQHRFLSSCFCAVCCVLWWLTLITNLLLICNFFVAPQAKALQSTVIRHGMVDLEINDGFRTRPLSLCLISQHA